MVSHLMSWMRVPYSHRDDWKRQLSSRLFVFWPNLDASSCFCKWRWSGETHYLLINWRHANFAGKNCKINIYSSAPACSLHFLGTLLGHSPFEQAWGWSWLSISTIVKLWLYLSRCVKKMNEAAKITKTSESNKNEIVEFQVFCSEPGGSWNRLSWRMGSNFLLWIHIRLDVQRHEIGCRRFLTLQFLLDALGLRVCFLGQPQRQRTFLWIFWIIPQTHPQTNCDKETNL